MGAQQSKQSTPTLVDLQHIISTLSSGETPYVFSNLFRGDWVKDHTNPRYAVLVGILNDMCSQLERRRTRFSNNPRVSQKKWKDVVDVCNSDDCESDADSDQPLAQLVKSGNSAGTSSSGFDSQVARKAFFEQPFQSHSNYLTSYMEYVSGIQWQWANDSKSKKKYYSMYHPVVNGSYMGKTRMLHEVLRRLSLGVFLNTSSSKHACPPPNEKVRDWLLKNCGESSKFAIQNLMAFTTAVAAQMVEWLEGFKVKNPFKDQAQIFFAWNEEQAGENSDLFWSKVLETQQAEVGRLTYWGQVRHVKSYGDKKLRKAAKDMLRFEHLATSPTDSAGLTTTFKLQEGSQEIQHGIKRAFTSRQAFLCKEMDKLLWDTKKGIFKIKTDFSKERDRLLKAWGERNHIWPTWLFVFDESTSLLSADEPEDPSSESVLSNICRIGQFVPRQKHSMCFVLSDTPSSTSFLSPEEKPNQKDPESGDTRFPPFWDVKSIDVYEFKTDTLREVVKIGEYSKYGRAGLHASILSTDGDEEKIGQFVKYLGSKMKAADDTVEATDTALVAILMFLVQIHVKEVSPLARTLSATHMVKCSGVSKDNHLVHLQQVPEPLLSYVAQLLVNDIGWLEMLRRLNKRGMTDIDCGAHGEVAGQILLLMAYQEAMKNNYLNDLAEEKFDLMPVALSQLLEYLGVQEEFIRDGREVLQRWKTNLDRSFVRFSQFILSHSEPTQAFFKGRFCRAAGIQCKRGTKGVDGFLPLLVTENGINENLEVSLPESSFSFVGLQYKNNADSLGPKKYGELSGSAMKAEAVLGEAIWLWDSSLPHVSLLIDVGPTRRDPDVWITESEDGMQLSITIRGVRPSDIFRDVNKMELAALVQEFDDFLAGTSEKGSDYSDKHTFSDISAVSFQSMKDDLGRRAEEILEFMELFERQVSRARGQVEELSIAIRACRGFRDRQASLLGPDLIPYRDSIEKLEEMRSPTIADVRKRPAGAADLTPIASVAKKGRQD